MRRPNLLLAAAPAALALGWLLWPAGDPRVSALGPAPAAIGGAGAPEPSAKVPPGQAPGAPRSAAPAVDPGAPAAPAAAPAEPVGSPATRLRVTLVDARAGGPLAGRRLELLPAYGPGAIGEGVTDAAGTCEVVLPPGEYGLYDRPAAGRGAQALLHALQPRRVEVQGRAAGGVQELTVRAEGPPAVLEVEVRGPDGAPAAGAAVSFTCRAEDPSLVDPGNRTDADGRVSLGVWAPEAFEAGRVTAQGADGLVSEVLPIEAPFVPGLRRLTLAPAARLTVRVLAHDGAPAAGLRTLLASQGRHTVHVHRVTDPTGRLEFRGLFAGPYRLGVRPPDGEDWQHTTLELGSGEARELTVRLAAPREPVAVAGLVLDEEGRPLAGVELGVRVDGARRGNARSDADGAFLVRCPPGRRVEVGPGLLPEADRYEPAAAAEPFGTRGLRFVRVGRAARRAFEVEVRDALTGAELPRFVAELDRGPGSEAWSDHHGARRRFELPLVPGSRLRVKASGHVTRELSLWEALEGLEPGERLRVRLDPGLDHTLRVLDAETRAPLAGVALRSGAGEAVTDGEGRARLVGDRWSVYRVSKEGYAATEWDPETDLLWGRGALLLERR